MEVIFDSGEPSNFCNNSHGKKSIRALDEFGFVCDSKILSDLFYRILNYFIGFTLKIFDKAYFHI